MALNDVKEIAIPNVNDITGYTRVEYVESLNNTSTPVSLGFIPTANTKIDFDFMITKCNNTAWNPFFGARGATNTTYFAGLINGTSNLFTPNYAGFDPGNNSGVTLTLNKRYNIKNVAGRFIIDNSAISSITTTNTLVTGTVNFYLFCTGTPSGYYTRSIEMRVYGFKAYESGTLIRNLVPCVRNSDNKAGLYDLVNNTFYLPTVGDLVAGPEQCDVKKIEDANGNIIWGSQSAFPYRRLEYINFSGTEYVLTNDKPTNNRYYYLNFSLNSIVNDKFIFAANGNSNSNGTFRVTVRTSSSSYAQSRYGRNSSTNDNISSVSTNTIYQNRLRIYNDYQSYFAIANSSGTVLGSKYYSATTFTPSAMYPFAIMGYNNSGTVGNMTSGKVYRYFYRTGDASGNITCDCYPCQRKSDNVCGLYDTVNNTFLPMVGTNITTTAAGPITDEYWDLTA